MSVAFFFLCVLAAQAQTQPNVVIEWSQAALQAVRAHNDYGPPPMARAMAIAHTCMYDAWAAYDPVAVGTRLGSSLRQPAARMNLASKNQAISYAAYRCLVDLFPAEAASIFTPLMRSLGYDPNNYSTNTATPAGVGNVAAAAVLTFRHSDGSNQLGDLNNGPPYSDYTGFVPVNSSTYLEYPSYWQPLPLPGGGQQTFITPQWYLVTPFSLTSGSQYRSLIGSYGPATYPSKAYRQEVAEDVSISAGLTDQQKMIAEYWANGPNNETAPCTWDLFAQYVLQRDGHSLDQDVKMFFAMTNAIFDASIVAWDAKRAFDAVRPISAIRFLYSGKYIQAWGGPYQGTQTMLGDNWQPYLPATPPFPEYISGHATFGATAAQVLTTVTGSSALGWSVTLAPGSSFVEPGFTPAEAVTLSWSTFMDAAQQNAVSRQYGGVHFATADNVGLLIGTKIGMQAYTKAASYWNGTAQ